MSRYLLDTNTCVEYLRNRVSVVERVHSFQPTELSVCSVVIGELLFGALRSTDPVCNVASVEEFVATFLSWPFDDLAAATYSQIRYDLTRKGTPIGPNDLMIGSIARSRDQILVTHNRSEFSRISGLTLEDWQD